MKKNPFESSIVKVGKNSKDKIGSKTKKQMNSLEVLAKWRPLSRTDLRTRERIDEAKEWNLRILMDYPNDKLLVVRSSNMDEPLEATAGELRRELSFMDDPEKGRAHGWPYRLFIESEHPEKYFEFHRQKLEGSRDRYLDKLAEYTDDQLVWVVYPNEGAQCHKTTVGELRRMLENYDNTVDQWLSHVGGFSVVSIDPDFDAEGYERSNLEMFREMVAGAAEHAMDTYNVKSAFMERLQSLDPSTLLRVKYADEVEARLISAVDLGQEIMGMSGRAFEARGIPEVAPLELKKSKRLPE